jgi:hypothetical protein
MAKNSKVGSKSSGSKYHVVVRVPEYETWDGSLENLKLKRGRSIATSLPSFDSAVQSIDSYCSCSPDLPSGSIFVVRKDSGNSSDVVGTIGWRPEYGGLIGYTNNKRNSNFVYGEWNKSNPMFLEVGGD